MLIPEVNLGQLLMLIRAQFLIDAEGYNRVRGKPFTIAEIVAQAERILRSHRMTEQDMTDRPRPAAAQPPRTRRSSS